MVTYFHERVERENVIPNEVRIPRTAIGECGALRRKAGEVSDLEEGVLVLHLPPVRLNTTQITLFLF